VKTAISLPDATFERATRRAHQLGISRSEFFVIAADRYLADLDDQSLTAQIDAALETTPTDDSADAAVSAGRARLRREPEW